MGSNTWCCDSAFEDCENKVGICIPKFENPVKFYTKQKKTYTSLTTGGAFSLEYTVSINEGSYSQYPTLGGEIGEMATRTSFSTRSSFITTKASTIKTTAETTTSSPQTTSASSNESKKTGDSSIGLAAVEEEKKSGISTGAAAGAGIGASIALIAIVAGIILYRRRRRAAAAAAAAAAASSAEDEAKIGYYTDISQYQSPAPELGGMPVYQELPPQTHFGYELEGSTASGELEAINRRANH